jgi:hypothetical protein
MFVSLKFAPAGSWVRLVSGAICREGSLRMPREITDTDGVTWSCIQAFAGLGNDPAKAEAARVEGTADRFHVACTPSGGARSVRLELPGGWEEGCTDEQILAAIRSEME